MLHDSVKHSRTGVDSHIRPEESSMKWAVVSFPGRKLWIAAISVAVFALVTFANAQTKLVASSAKPQITLITCGAGGTDTLPPIRDAKTDLKVVGICYVNGTIDTGRTSLLWVFRNVNIVSGCALIFQEGKPIDFYAESVLVEYKGALTAVSSNAAPGYATRLTIHLWGAPTDDGMPCASDARGGAPCGIPDELWTANPGMANNLMMTTPPPPTRPKNAPCKSVTGYSQYLPDDDCFYQYEVQDLQDRTKGLKAYFGHMVLAVSFGGTLQLQGAKGSIFPNPLNCSTTDPTSECSPPDSSGGSLSGGGEEFLLEGGGIIYDSGMGTNQDMQVNSPVHTAKQLSKIAVDAVADVRQVPGHENFTPPEYNTLKEISQYRLRSDGSR